jgi:plasmid stabilization system protein ParE
MSCQHVYDPVALLEYTDTITWYAERSEMAAANFVTAIKEKIALICKNPLRYRNTYKKFRETSLAVYPYSAAV